MTGGVRRMVKPACRHIPDGYTVPMANERARELRKCMTSHEVRLWLSLRALRPQGLHFRRQVPQASYILDFGGV